MMRKMNRREYIKRTTLSFGVASLFLSPWSRAMVKAQSPNETIRIGCIGVGGQGRGDSMVARGFGKIVAMCDADLRQAHGAAEMIAPDAEIYQHYRRLLDRNDIDVIVQACPDHWHTKINIDACESGKDVYAEKPITLTIDEGKKLRAVVERTKRIVQVGTQQRSIDCFRKAVELVRNGRIGKLSQVWVALPYFSTKGGPFATAEVPAEMDWDLYQGQAPLADYMLEKSRADFRWWYEYAGGIVTDWGNHHVDIAQWGMDTESTGPTTVEARGLFPNEGKPNCYNTPDRFFSRMNYANGLELLYFSAMGEKWTYGEVQEHVETTEKQLDWMFGPGTPEEIRTFNRNGIMFIGDKGRIFVNRGGLYGKAADELANRPFTSTDWRVTQGYNNEEIGDDGGVVAHMRNFFDCIASREEPIAPVWKEHRSLTCCHLTNISLRLEGQKFTWDAEKETITDCPAAATMLAREQRAPYTI